MRENIAVIGLGYVGLPLALLAERAGYNVMGIDIDPEKIETILHQFPQIRASRDFSQIAFADTVIICVPTPVYENRLPNYEPLISAIENISEYLKKYSLVVIESTVNPGVCEEVAVPLIEKISSFTKDEFYLAHCPERINPGDDKWNVSNIPRVVGGMNKRSLDKAYKFYESILSAPIEKMNSLKEAEAVKIVENSFRNINIAFVNELAQSFNRLGIDVMSVINGASTKPFAFMPHFPGCGVGGHCIPVDPYYLIDYAKKNGYSHRFLSLACEINEEMPSYTVQLLKEELKKKNKNLRNAKIVILGLSYKADIGDMRESPSLNIMTILKNLKANVVAVDPHINGAARSLDEVVYEADAIILATNHKEFSQLTPEYLHKNKVGILIDGRNYFNKDIFVREGIAYRGIGR